MTAPFARPFSAPFAAGLPTRNSSQGVVYDIINDEFSIDVAAGAVNNTFAVPGPGKRAANQTTNSTHVITGGQLVTTAGPANDNVQWRDNAGNNFARAEGFLVKWPFRALDALDSANLEIVDSGGTNQIGVLLNTTLLYIKSAGNAYTIVLSANVDYELILVLDATGGKVFLFDGLVYRLMLVDQVMTGAAVNVRLNNTSRDLTSPRLLAGNIGSRFADTGFAGLNVASPANATDYAVSAAHDLLTGSAIYHLTVTAPGTLSGAAELLFRYVDASNFWAARLDSAGACRLRKVVAGVETDNIVSKAGVVAAGETITLAVIAYSETVQVVTRKGVSWNAIGVTGTAGNGLGQTGVRVACTDYSPTLLQAWPVRTSLTTAVNGLPRTTGTFLTIGDSKTSAVGFHPTLESGLETATGHAWEQCPRKIAVSGYTTADMESIIADELALRYDTPDHVLINLGSNDLSAMPTETAFKASYRTIIETTRGKYLATTIYLARPVRLDTAPPSAPNANVSVLHGWINDLIAEYDYVYAGIDETDLEGGDSYVTYLADTTHPTAAGYVKTGELWQARLLL